MKRILFVLLVITCYSCSLDSDNDNHCQVLDLEGVELYRQLTNAALAYLDDPTSANCQEYRDLAEEYINNRTAFKNCLSIENFEAIEQEIEDLESELEEIDCNG